MNEYVTGTLTRTPLVFRNRYVWIEGTNEEGKTMANHIMSRFPSHWPWDEPLPRMISEDDVESLAGARERIRVDQKTIDNQRNQIREHVDTIAFLRGTIEAQHKKMEDMTRIINNVREASKGWTL